MLDLLVVAPNGGSSFVEADVAGLARWFGVERLAFRDFPGKPAYLRALTRMLRRRRPAVVLLWFLAPQYALETIALARAFSARVVVAAGGLEVDVVPELGLGGLRWPHNRLRQRLGLVTADLVLAPSEFLAGRIRQLARPRRLEVVHNGIDTAHFAPDGRAKERLALTVCFEVTRETSVLKGLPEFVAAAGHLTDVEFVAVGRPGGDGALARLQELAPPNVRFSGGRVSDNELLELYRRAKVYVQPSAHEAFGVAVAESMACHCVPVLADQQALHEVAGEAAVFVPFGAADRVAAAVEESLALPDDAGARARARIVERFTIERRVERLVALLTPLVERGGE